MICLQKIKITGIPNDISLLVGFNLGKKIFRENQLGNYAVEKGIQLEFPDTIERVSASFVQGFLSAYVEKVGKGLVRENVVIKMKNDTLSRLFMDKLY